MLGWANTNTLSIISSFLQGMTLELGLGDQPLITGETGHQEETSHSPSCHQAANLPTRQPFSTSDAELSNWLWTPFRNLNHFWKREVRTVWAFCTMTATKATGYRLQHASTAESPCWSFNSLIGVLIKAWGVQSKAGSQTLPLLTTEHAGILTSTAETEGIHV